MIESKSGLVDMQPDPYRGLNPSFVRRVWAKRRAESGEPAKTIPLPRQPTRQQRSWTVDEKAQLSQLLDNGFTVSAAARRLSRSRSSVECFIKRQRKESRG